MRRMFLLTGAALVVGGLVPEMGEAQSASAGVTASATVLAHLVVERESDLAFGTLNPGDGASLTPGSAPGAGQTLGVIRIEHNSAVSVSAALPSELTLAGNPGLPVSFQCGYSASAGGALDGSATACDALPNRPAVTNGTTRTSYVQIGGAIAGAETLNRAPGTYTGTLTFTVNAVY